MTILEGLLRKFIPYSATHRSWPQVLSIFVLALIAFTCGSMFVWTSPSIPILISNSSKIEVISLESASYFTVLPPVASILTVPFVSILTDKIGRKNMLLLIAIPHVTCWILIAFAKDIYMFYASRAISGIADSILFSSIPMYMGEISTPRVRGSWGNLIALGIYLGQLFINVVGSYCDIKTTALIFCCFPILALLLALMLPESPYYCIMKGQEQKARDCLRTLRWCDDVEDELMTLTKDVNRQISESGTFRDLVTIPTNRKALLISIGIRGCQQLSGLPAFAVYTQLMFNRAGGSFSSSTSAIIFMSVLVVAISGFAFIVDRFGRKILMTFSCFSCAVILLIEGTYFYLDKETSVDVSFLKWLPLVGMIIYILCCSSGLGIIPTLMLGELFSASIKSKALGILQIFFALYVLSVSKLFQTLTQNFGMHVPFYMFGCCCVCSAVFSYFCIPETKGKTLEEIQRELSGVKRIVVKAADTNNKMV